jgi:hypothetical protein
MANLPKERLQADDPPFTRIGIDFFGPFEVKLGRSVVKRYGVIFTCLNIRAIHLELAHSLEFPYLPWYFLHKTHFDTSLFMIPFAPIIQNFCLRTVKIEFFPK